MHGEGGCEVIPLGRAVGFSTEGKEWRYRPSYPQIEIEEVCRRSESRVDEYEDSDLARI